MSCDITVAHHAKDNFLNTRVLIAFLIFSVFGVAATPTLAREKAAPPMRFSDGAIGSTGDECSLGDLCGTLTFTSGDRIDIYNGGAPHCKPYTLNIVRMHGENKLFDYKTESDKADDQETGFGKACGKFKNTTLTFDSGLARLDFFQSHDGSLFSRWNGGTSDTTPNNSTTIPVPNSAPTSASKP